MKTLLIDKNDCGYLKITINRPEKRNAVNFQLMDELRTVLDEAERNPAVKILILTGSGTKAFCSGGDLGEFHSLHTEQEAYQMLSKMGSLVRDLAFLRKPTVAYLNGSAVGGGCEIAAACDFRIARSGVKLGFIQGTLGITTGWGGASLLLEKLPVQNALKMLMESGIYSAEEAMELGFISCISNETNPALHLENLLKREAEILSSYKNILINKWEASGLKERMEEEIRKCAVLWASESHHQAVKDFLQKKN
ncbi:enoyl-CoA hydratase/isomerase family protein [Bacillus massiliglaciei]|uniref:enoyl-CoA hydratase/isomerase family protein n=1 Tax=Bacillus massiliglaciei TaxID=1816693 RepID=UPI000AB34ED9|nr:enoyl-CoA hydratase/isomerase family protein [Bacillus massiliglaciei]